ncbi:MAG: heme exporter protein CcmB [Egibacteraceae bacterium]
MVAGWSQALRVAARDVAVEVSGREAATAVVPLVVAAVLLAGLAFGPRPDVLAAVGPGLSWLVVLFAAVPLARGVAAAEQAEGCWDLLRAFVSPASLLAGKVLALWLWLVAAWALSTALTVGLFNAPVAAAAVLAGPLGTLGLAGVTVTFGTVLASAEGRSGLLAVLLLPAGLPALLAGTEAGTSGVAPLPWLGLLLAYNLVSLAVAWAVFPFLLEE